MLSASQIKYIQSLQQKKYRDRHQAFVAEGDKIVRELLKQPDRLEMVCGLKGWLQRFRDQIPETVPCNEVTARELQRASHMRTPHQALAVVRKPVYYWQEDIFFHDLVLMLDNLQDPGNLGTILRTADWFGIKHVFSSPGTADMYNPKVIQASMGSFLRVKTYYEELPDIIRSIHDRIPVYGTFLEGDNLFKTKSILPAVLVIGNESRGISPEVATLVTNRLQIPAYEPNRPEQKAESLNAAMAGGITMAWFRQNMGTP
ncbi:MAG: RNA methyltransferase [Bacteroidales bacterium]